MILYAFRSFIGASAKCYTACPVRRLTMQKTVRLIIKDGLGFPSGFISPASYTCVLYYRLPESWVAGDTLPSEKVETLLENMYGKTWRQGNSDGSYYAVLSLQGDLLTPEEEQQRGWLQNQSPDPDFQYWYYHVAEDGQFKVTTRDEF